MKGKVILLVGILSLLMLSATAVRAGGWVVISVDSIPTQIHAGEVKEISFMVRQHGKTPIHDVEPLLTATNAETGKQIRVQAQPAPELGRFIAIVDFPSAGVWDWSISAKPFPQTATFAPLTVLAAQSASATEVNSQPQPAPGIQTPLRWGGFVLLMMAALLLVLNRRQDRAATSPVSGD